MVFWKKITDYGVIGFTKVTELLDSNDAET